MKRIFSVPAIGLFIALLLANKISNAQTYFKAEVIGKGQPMILIHGLYCSGDVWKEVVEHYATQYECHVLTLAGFGGNEAKLNDHFLESVKDDILTYVDKKKLKNLVIMGHSMGAFISFWTAASAPKTFSKVIAVDGVPFMGAVQMPGATPESMKPMATNMRDMMSSLTPEQTIANQRMYLPTMIRDKSRIDQVLAIASRCDNKTQGQVMYELFTIDLREKVNSIECPVMLMGAWVAYKPYGVSRESVMKTYSSQVKGIKNHQVEISDSAMHFIFFDEPQWFFEKTDAFLARPN